MGLFEPGKVSQAKHTRAVVQTSLITTMIFTAVAIVAVVEGGKWGYSRLTRTDPGRIYSSESESTDK